MNKKDSMSEKKDFGTTANEETQTSSSNGSEQPSEWASKPEDAVIIDDAFWIKRQRWGTFISIDKTGKAIITSLEEEHCASATRWYLKLKQDGFPDSATSYDSVVGGKL